MRNIDMIPVKPPIRRVCADFHGADAVELDILEARLGISRAARNKSERDAVLMELAVLSLKKQVEAYSQQTGDPYPSYDSLASWLESRHGTEINGHTADQAIKALNSPDGRSQETPHEHPENGV
ncbi:hypothetical protein [Candidatus Igneacidithiobacillus taiwanensis]|uniref:hypothetical protein n=1 Tax=Candidatus Igneacidithiobacillus taiwanensis TaxID=1945924 RepID=UPI0028975FA6|nr:hypothetical protein [Candidatus Igneacidithiobacillus taiwanensis]